MKTFILLFFLATSSINSIAQEPSNFIETTATITEVRTQINDC